MKTVKQLSGRTAEDVFGGWAFLWTHQEYLQRSQTHGWWRGGHCPFPKNPNQLMALLASDLWINACSIINLAFLIATASSCNDTVN